MHGSSISLLEVCILESSYDVVIFCALKFCLKVKIIRQKKKIKFNIDGMRGFAARCHLFLLCHEIYKKSAICLVIFSIDIICEAVVYLH